MPPLYARHAAPCSGVICTLLCRACGSRACAPLHTPSGPQRPVWQSFISCALVQAHVKRASAPWGVARRTCTAKARPVHPALVQGGAHGLCVAASLARLQISRIAAHAKADLPALLCGSERPSPAACQRARGVHYACPWRLLPRRSSKYPVAHIKSFRPPSMPPVGGARHAYLW